MFSLCSFLDMCRAIIEEDLGMPLASAFSSVDEAPLATASIAQVHRAVHRESGKDVVIKVGTRCCNAMTAPHVELLCHGVG